MTTHYLDSFKQLLSDLLCEAVHDIYKVDISSQKSLIYSKFQKPKPEFGDVCFACFLLAKDTKQKPNKIAQDIAIWLSSKLEGNSSIARLDVEDAYLNFSVGIGALANVIELINDGSFLKARSTEGKMKVMIEYSQPNTHKVFHVGHMRNAALGDSLVRFYEQIGHPVIASNYFGDEGAHVAKCLWALRRYIKEHNFDIDTVPVEQRGEFLGGFYSKGVEEIALDTFTFLPNPGVFTAKVEAMKPHPNEKAPPNWHVVTVTMGKGSHTVVCGGHSYKEGDIIAYLPVGQKLKGKLVEAKDMMGVSSEGVILARREVISGDKAEEPQPVEEDKGKKGKKDTKQEDNAIYVLPSNTPIGLELPELGRRHNTSIPPDTPLVQEVNARNEEVKELLRAMEHGDPEACNLWKKTRLWSLDEFKVIYKWLNCRFDHDFFESDVGEESNAMVRQYFADGKLVKSDGAIGADLSKHGLGFCMLLKTNGSGLYATKDLALARRKFTEFAIDKSIYIVDAAQTLHFKQVFKTLELLGFEQAKNCYHLSYGTVILPDGKMSSRKGNVVFFSQLKDLLSRKIREDFESKKKTTDYSKEEIDQIERALSVATIKYGMLNHDTGKDIVFELDEWSATTGNTGPYMMYAYARIKSILRKFSSTHPVNWNLLDESERIILGMLNDVWVVIDRVAQEYNPSPMCDFMFALAKAFSGWYESHSVQFAETEELRATRLALISAVAAVLKLGLQLLGISTVERM